MFHRFSISTFLCAVLGVFTLSFAGCGGGGGSSSSSSSSSSSGSGSNAPTVTISASSATITNGSPDNLTWATTNATSVTISPAIQIEDVSTLPVNYTAPVSPLQTTTYTITATGPGGTVTASTTITVNQVAPTVNLTLTPTTIQSGQSSTLTWSTGHASALTIVDGAGHSIPVSSPASGSVTVNPTATTTYTATVTGYAATAGGTAPTATATATLTISALAATLTANPVSLATTGQSATLTYSVVTDPGQTVTVSISNNALASSTNPTGTVTVTPGVTTTYVLTATQANGVSTTAKATVTVGSGLANIKHIIFLVQENHDFDNYFGKLGLYRANDPFTGQSYGAVTDVNGIGSDSDPQFTIKDHNGNPLAPFHQPTVCIDDLSPAWDESHADIDLQGATYKMDGFANKTAVLLATGSNDPAGRRVSGYYDWTDLPYYYELATQYATNDAWYAPELANTVPNRMYLFAGTSYGTTYPQVPAPGAFQQPVIFDTLGKNNISWTYYSQDGSSFLGYYNNPSNTNFSADGLGTHYAPISQLMTALASPTADSTLPEVIYIEKGAGTNGGDEHPGDGNMQQGAANTASIINAFLASPIYADSIFILTWDDPGGFYDHVPPQPMPAPDNVAPSTQSPDGTTTVDPGNFQTTGLRLPMVVISPWVKPHYVSHTVRDSTAILALIEARFNLPPLTARDAAQDNMVNDMFDFTTPSLLTPPTLPPQPTTGVCNPALEAGP
jgi:phospholipase C